MSLDPFVLYPTVFCVAVVNDFVWSAYINNVQLLRAARAGSWAAGTLLLGAFNIISYTHNSWALLPAALGGFVGTYIAVKLAARKAAA